MNGLIIIRTMMSPSLSYDYNIVYEKSVVTFLVRVNECLTDPGHMLPDIRVG